MDNESLAKVIERQLVLDHRDGLIRLGDTYEVASLSRRIADRVMIAIKVEHDFGLDTMLRLSAGEGDSDA